MSNIIFSAFSDEYAKDFGEQLSGMKELGIGYIELRFIDGRSVADISLDEASALKARLDENGIKVSAIGSPLGKIRLDGDMKGHMETAEKIFKIANIMETKLIRMFSFYAPKDKDIHDYKDEVLCALSDMLALAKKYRLYRWIQMAIATHHGNDLVRYFYHEAKKQQENDSDAPAVLEAQFRYDGEPPRAKELVILSLADACEAATRSLAKPSAANIEALVNKIFLTRYEEGQLSNAEISFAELDKVRKSVIKSLTTDYHGRVAYPEQTNAKDKV